MKYERGFMSNQLHGSRHCLVILVASVAFLQLATPFPAHTQVTNDPPSSGPYNAVFLPDGEGLKKPLVEHDSVLRADSPWSLYCWMRTETKLRAPTLRAGLAALT